MKKSNVLKGVSFAIGGIGWLISKYMEKLDRDEFKEEIKAEIRLEEKKKSNS